MLRYLLLLGALGVPALAMAKPDSQALLRTSYVALHDQLQKNQFGQPLVLASAETSRQLTGDVYAVMDYAFDSVTAGLNNPGHWCEVMLLHLNTKYCRAVVGPSATRLQVNVGRKTPEPLSSATRVEFDYSVLAVQADYFSMRLSAQEGPLGTSDYRIQFEALALPRGQTFLHLTYAYQMNFSARLAMQTYLATLASDKVGFTIIGQQANGAPDYIGGVRGLVERNTMRYYLAIHSFLAVSTASTPPLQFEQRLQHWFTAAERYPSQLHEMNRQEYLQMKRSEYQRQQTAP